MLGGAKTVAMQYSPTANIPYVSIVDGGTIDLIRSLGYEVVSSAGLVQTFQAVLDEAGYQSHLEAGARVQRIKDEAFALIGDALRAGRTLTQYDVQQFIVRRFGEEGLTCKGEYPIVGTNEQPADPHFEPTPANARPIKAGDTMLIDLWAKLDQPGAVFYDITWCGFVGQNPPAKYVEIFNTVRDARNAALAFIRDRYAAGKKLYGWEVDDACREVVEKAGYGEYFIHRTGPLDRRGSARQRRQHRQPRDEGRARAGAGDLLLDRAGDLPGRRDGGALRDQRVHHAGREGRRRRGDAGQLILI